MRGLRHHGGPRRAGQARPKRSARLFWATTAAAVALVVAVPASLAGGHFWSLPGSLAAAVVASVGCVGVATFALSVAVTPDARTPGRPYWLLLGASILILGLLEVAVAVVCVWALVAGAAFGGGG